MTCFSNKGTHFRSQRANKAVRISLWGTGIHLRHKTRNCDEEYVCDDCYLLQSCVYFHVVHFEGPTLYRRESKTWKWFSYLFQCQGVQQWDERPCSHLVFFWFHLLSMAVLSKLDRKEFVHILMSSPTKVANVPLYMWIP